MARSTKPDAVATPHVSWWRQVLDFSGLTSASTPAKLPLFPPGFLEALERLHLLAVSAAGGLKEGRRLGRYRGGQLEFQDYRPYSPGDDLRYVDWNLFARLGQLQVKEFAREEAGAVHVLLDASPSMALGEHDPGMPGKWTYARRTAAGLAHLAWAARDQARCFVLRNPEGAPSVYPPRGTRPETLDFFKWLGLQHTAPPGNQIENAPESSATQSNRHFWTAGIAAFLRQRPTRGRVFIISDFWHEERDLDGALRRLSASGFEPSALHVLRPEEQHPARLQNSEGRWRIEALEEPGSVEVSGSEQMLDIYGREFAKHRLLVEKLFTRRGGQYFLTTTDVPAEKLLSSILRKRRWIS